MAQIVKSLPAMRETQIGSLDWEEPLEKEMATHSSILAWRIPMDRGAWGYSPRVCARVHTLSHFSCVRLFATPWTVAHQASLSMGFSRKEHWSGLPCPPPGDLPDPGIKPASPALHADSFTAELPGKPSYSPWGLKRVGHEWAANTHTVPNLLSWVTHGAVHLEGTAEEGGGGWQERLHGITHVSISSSGSQIF